MSRMLDATVALVVGTFISIGYWFALAGPINTITAAVDAIRDPNLFTGRNAGGLIAWTQFNGLTANIFGVWVVATLVSYLIMYVWEATRTEDVVREVYY